MQPVVYDKAKYHDDTIEELGLPEEHASNHAVFFLRWLIDHSLVSSFFLSESADMSVNREIQVGLWIPKSVP